MQQLKMTGVSWATVASQVISMVCNVAPYQARLAARRQSDDRKEAIFHQVRQLRLKLTYLLPLVGNTELRSLTNYVEASLINIMEAVPLKQIGSEIYASIARDLEELRDIVQRVQDRAQDTELDCVIDDYVVK